MKDTDKEDTVKRVQPYGPDGKPLKNPKQPGQNDVGPDDTEELDERNTDLAEKRPGAKGRSAQK